MKPAGRCRGRIKVATRSILVRLTSAHMGELEALADQLVCSKAEAIRKLIEGRAAESGVSISSLSEIEDAAAEGLPCYVCGNRDTVVAGARGPGLSSVWAACKRHAPRGKKRAAP